MTPNPTPVGLWICERVITEEGTGFPSLISIFSARAFEQFPVHPVPFFVYSILTGAEGTGRIELRVISADDLEVLYEGIGRIEFPERLAKLTVNILVDELLFPSPGVYFFELLIDGELIAQTRFKAEQSES